MKLCVPRFKISWLGVDNPKRSKALHVAQFLGNMVSETKV